MEQKQIHDSTPSSCRNPLVEKVRNSNINCDSPFRSANTSTPPTRIFKIRNPFESPLLERLHLPVCSPGLFLKSTPKKEEHFVWSICDISHLKPAEIDTNIYQESISTTFDPQTESLIQDKISSFFRRNAIVPSPAPRDNTERKKSCLLPDKSNSGEGSSAFKRLEEGSNESAMDISSDQVNYLPEEEYYKKLFDFESETPQSSPSVSPPDSPVQFSPPQELVAKSFSDEMDKKIFNLCGLSPISSENDNSKNSTRELKSVCRLVFSEDSVCMNNSFNLVRNKDNSLEATVIESGLVSGEMLEDNSGLMSIDDAFEKSECEKMDVSLIHTPKMGIFVSQRKRLSDSFKDLHSEFSQPEELEEVSFGIIDTKSRLLCEGSSDTGYQSASVQPSIIENTWNNSHVFSSTPTRRK